jgi:predicted metal-binding transcription factor (methanogenesis marker protein 9)
MNRLVNLLKKIELLAEAYMFIKLEEKIIDNQQLSQEEIKIFGRLQSNELIKKILMTSLNFSI